MAENLKSWNESPSRENAKGRKGKNKMSTDKVIDIKGRQKWYNIWMKSIPEIKNPKIADKNYSKIFLKLNFLKWRKKIQAAFWQLPPEQYAVPENKGIIPFSTVKPPTTPKKGKNMAQNRPQKDTCLQYERWNKKADPQPGMCMLGDSEILPLCKWPWNVCAWPWKHRWVLVWGLQIHISQ